MGSYSYSYRSAELEKSPAGPSKTCYQYNDCPSEDDRLELKLKCPTISSLRWCLKLYTLVLGGLSTFLSFIWVCFHLYVLSQTEIHDLRLLRYLDIFLGLVMFSSTISLIYAGITGSKNWLVIFTCGSMSVIVLYWGWSGYNKYVSLDHPDFSEEVEEVGVVLTIVYFILLIPLILYYRAVDTSSSPSSSCSRGGHRCTNCSHLGPPPSYRSSQQGKGEE